MPNYKFACSTCSQRIAYDENAFGRKIRCPNCKSIITIPVPEGASAVGAAPAPPPPAPGPKPGGPVAARPISGKPAARAAASSGGGESKKSLVIMVVVVLLMVGGGVAAFLMGRGGDGGGAELASSGPDETSPSEQGGMPGDGESEMAGDMAAAKAFDGQDGTGGDSGKAADWAPQDAQFFVSLRPAQLMETPLVKGLLAKQPQAMQQLAAVEQMAGFQVADIDSVLVAVSGLEELVDKNLGGLKPGSPQAQMALMQAGQKMNDKQVVIVKFAKPVDLEANPMLSAQPEAQFNGVSYRKMQPQPGAPAIAIYSPDQRTLIAGAEKQVQKAIAGKGKGGAGAEEFSQLREDHHLALVFSPSSDLVAKMREVGATEEMKGGPAAELMSRHVNGGLLALTSEDTGIALQAVMSGDDAEAASAIAAALKERLAEAPKQLEMMQSAIPAGLRGAADKMAASLSAKSEGTAVEFAANIPAELLSEEGMNALMGFAMAQAMQAGSSPKPATTTAKPDRGKPDATKETKVASMPEAEAPVAEAPEAVEMPAKQVAVGETPAPGEPSAQPVEKKPSRMLTAWTMNIPNAGIPEEPVSGTINNQEFKLDSALIENGVLILRKGSVKYPVLVVEVHNIQQPGEALDGKKFELPNVSGFNTPKVVMKWEDAAKLKMPMRLFDNSFAIKLEFGSMVEGKIKGKVFIAVPDGRKSFVSGSFEAEVF